MLHRGIREGKNWSWGGLRSIVGLSSSVPTHSCCSTCCSRRERMRSFLLSPRWTVSSSPRAVAIRRLALALARGDCWTCDRSRAIPAGARIREVVAARGRAGRLQHRLLRTRGHPRSCSTRTSRSSQGYSTTIGGEMESTCTASTSASWCSCSRAPRSLDFAVIRGGSRSSSGARRSSYRSSGRSAARRRFIVSRTRSSRGRNISARRPRSSSSARSRSRFSPARAPSASWSDRVTRQYLIGLAHRRRARSRCLPRLARLASIRRIFRRRSTAGSGAGEQRRSVVGAWRSFAFVCRAGGLGLATLQQKVSIRAAAWILVFLVAIDLWTVERIYWMFSPPAKVIYASDPIVDTLKAETQPVRVLRFHSAADCSGQIRFLAVMP